jgi:hypothetical protein
VEKRPKRSEVFEESITVRRGNHRTRRQGMDLPETAVSRWSGESGEAQRCSTVVEARGRRRRAPMNHVDGEGDGEGELCAATEGRRKSTRVGGYHREQ